MTGSVLGRALEISVAFDGRSFPVENYLIFKTL